MYLQVASFLVANSKWSTCLAVVGCIDQLWDEVAGHGDQEGVGDDCNPGQPHHDVVPDAHVVHYPGGRLPIAQQQLLGIKSADDENCKSQWFNDDRTLFPECC